MMTRLRQSLAVAAFLAALGGPAHADSGDGLAAFKATDYATALRELTPAAKAGDPEAAFTLGRMYAAGLGVAKDPVRAVELYCVAADKGHAESQHSLGAALFLGEGIEQDMTEGLKWLVIANNNGFAPAQEYLKKVAPYVTNALMIEARKRARMWQAGGADEQTGDATQDRPAAPAAPVR
jgi:TPR repeat protein